MVVMKDKITESIMTNIRNEQEQCQFKPLKNINKALTDKGLVVLERVEDGGSGGRGRHGEWLEMEEVGWAKWRRME